MSWDTVRDAIEAELDAVTGIAGGAGQVLDYHPLVYRPDDFTSKFKGTSTINAWWITREGVRERQEGDGFRFARTHDVLIHGWYALKESTPTEDTFNDLVELVVAELRGPVTVWATQPESQSIGLRASINKDQLGKVLCEHCTIRFPVDEFALITS